MKHAGGCHCGAIRFEAEIPGTEVMSCNCSICMKRGSLLAFIPEASFTLIQGESNLTDYQFGKKNIHHLFCKTCGILSFSRGTGSKGEQMRAVNVRCLDDVDLSKYTIKEFDGKSI